MTRTHVKPSDISESATQPDPQAFLERLDHDMRTPLGTMLAALELLRHEPAGTSMHAESIAVLQRQVGRLQSLTDTLRDFAQTLGR